MIPLQQKHLKILAVVLISIVALRLVSLGRRSEIAPEATKHNQVLGEMSAMETASLIGGSGRVLLVSWADPDALITIREKAFENKARELDLTMAGIFRAEERDFHPLGGWSKSLYDRVAREYPDVDAVVSFVYAPPVGVLDGRFPRELAGHFVAVLPNTGNIDQYLQSGVVDLAVVPLPNPDDMLSTRVSSADWFHAYYRNLTATEARRAQLEDQPEGMEEPPETTYSEQVDISDRLR